MSQTRTTILLLVASLALTACGSPGPSQIDIAGTIDAAVGATVEALPSRTPVPALATPSQTPTQPNPVIPTEEATTPVTPAVQASVGVGVSVSLTTNCRTGPSLAYPRVFSIDPGVVAQVAGRSSDNSYWYIANPEQSQQHCWIWGKYATVTGDVSLLPVVTPEPVPAQQIDFTMYRHSFTQCGTARVALVVVNSGLTTFKSARVQVRDVTANNNIYGPVTDSSPFGDNPTSCPRDKSGESLAPGATAYLVIPLNDIKAGNQAAAYVNLCTKDDGEGTCVTKSAYFRLPSE